MTDDSSGGGRTLNTIENAVEILETLQELDGAGVTELAEQFDLTKGTMHTYLKTLDRQGLLVKNGTEYRVSLKVFEIGGRVRDGLAMYTSGRDPADRLAEDTGELVHLALEQQGVIHYVYQIHGSEAMKTTTPVGHTRPLHATAAGKTILAMLSDERRDALLQCCRFQALTAHTIDEREDLIEELDQVKERGYAINDREEIVGSRTLATPVSDSTGEVVGAVCLSGPASRFQEAYVSELVPQVKETANHIEVNLQRA